MEEINISQFKAICLRLLEQVKHTGEPITVLKKGEPLVVVYPAKTERKRPPPGFSRKSIEICGDIVSPLGGEDWDALKESGK